MFYSHEVLTDRRYGVATVWLVATLGSNSSLKKVSRKSILDVDVPKACDSIVAPAAPMALRLQSNLLYGVTRVYAQQCGYVLSDAETARNSMRMMLKAVRTGALEVEGGGNKGRDEQVLLQDDPDFLPDLDLLPVDIDQVDFGPQVGEDSLRSLLSPHTSQLASTPHRSHGSARISHGLMLPPSASPYSAGPVGGGMGSFSVRGDSGRGMPMDLGGLLDDDLGLVIQDDNENVTMVDDGDDAAARLSGSPVPVVHATAARNVGQEHEGSNRDRGFLAREDDDLAMMDDDYSAPRPAGEDEQSCGRVQSYSTSSTREAPMRQRKAAARKVIPFDAKIELRNGDLARWDTEYLANMESARHHKDQTRMTNQAKKNAQQWMLGEIDIGNRGPLSMFQGIQLLEALTGIDLHGPKRRREDNEEEGNSESDEGRRVRRRSEDPTGEIARGQQQFEDDYIPMVEDDTIEQGRRAPTPLEEHRQSSIMPWSRTGGSSGRPTFGSGYPRSLSIGGRSHHGGVGPLSRRGSRLTSASPLLGRSGVGGGGSSGGGLPFDDYPLPPASLSGGFGEEEFELYGPGANVDTQTAAQSQWLRTVLDGESAHFLAFVREAIDENKDRLSRADEEEAIDDGQDRIYFAKLLPPGDHGCVVAAQALLHVLSLGTKGVLDVKQAAAFGEIELRIVSVLVPGHKDNGSDVDELGSQ